MSGNPRKRSSSAAGAVDYSLDRIGDRLSGRNLTPHERVLAKDDLVRVEWILDAIGAPKTVVDIGASDGSIAQRIRWKVDPMPMVFAIEPHPAHKPKPDMWWFTGDALYGLDDLMMIHIDVLLMAEVLEHLRPWKAQSILRHPISADRLVVTVPNRASKRYDRLKRSRWAWPDHRQNFYADDLQDFLTMCGWKVGRIEPIVGTLTDSVWLGAVASRT